MEQPDLVAKYGIRQAPTLVVLENGAMEKLVGAGAIKRFAVAR